MQNSNQSRFERSEFARAYFFTVGLIRFLVFPFYLSQIQKCKTVVDLRQLISDTFVIPVNEQGLFVRGLQVPCVIDCIFFARQGLQSRSFNDASFARMTMFLFLSC